MKVRIKQRKKKFKMLPCGCCESVYFKDKCFDRQPLKEALQELEEDMRA